MDVPKGTPLVIIPDGILAILPFEALVVSGKATWSGSGARAYPEGLTYLGDLYPISYYQSITALSLARTLGEKKKPGESLLVVADPIFDMKDRRAQATRETRVASKDKDYRIKLMVAMEEECGLRFTRLPETATLASNLGSLFKGQSDIYTGMEATKQRFMKSAPELNRVPMGGLCHPRSLQRQDPRFTGTVPRSHHHTTGNRRPVDAERRDELEAQCGPRGPDRMPDGPGERTLRRRCDEHGSGVPVRRGQVDPHDPLVGGRKGFCSACRKLLQTDEARKEQIGGAQHSQR